VLEGSMTPVVEQIVDLFVIAIPIASISWTITHEELFREPREWCVNQSKTCRSLVQRKFFYLFTCEFCFSYYVSAAFLVLTRFKLLFDDWRGYVLALFSLVWVANFYMSVFGRVRLDIKRDRIEIDEKEESRNESSKK
jgi:hypothetical protein